jgi:hypothetical protein
MLSLVALTPSVSGCEMVKSAYVSQVGGAAEELAAVATTLRLVHEGRVTRQYAQSTFANYREVLVSFEPKLRKAEGAPAPDSVERAVSVYRGVAQVIESPCLDDGCDWRGQLAALETAAAALDEEVGG